MARELGLNPQRFGSLANHRQEPWKLPLHQFIENLYRKSFGVSRPAEVFSLEEMISRAQAMKEAKRQAKQAARDDRATLEQESLCSVADASTARNLV
jgi:hypothetical protein